MAFHFIVEKFYPEHESVRKNSNNVNINQAHMCSKAVKSVKSDSGATARLQKLEKTVKSQNHIITKMMATINQLKAKPAPAPTPTVKADTATKVEAGIPASSGRDQDRITYLKTQIASVTAKIQSSNNFRELEILRASLNGLCAELDALEAQQLRASIQKQAENQDVAFMAAWRSGSALTARNLFNRPW